MNNHRCWLACKAIVSISVVISTAGCGGEGHKNSAPTGAPTVIVPDTQITSAPPALTRFRSATFEATSSVAASMFEASVDGGPFKTVSLPLVLNDLTDGEHTISIRARTVAGAVDQSPATFSWVVDATPPVVEVRFPLPVSYTDAGVITVRGIADDGGTIASLSVNGVAATSSDGYKSWSADVALTKGKNTIAISASDAAGNSASGGAAVTVMKQDPLIADSGGLDYDPGSQRLIMADRGTGQIYTVGTDGTTSILTPRSSDIPERLHGLIVDAARNRALVLSDVTLDAIDLASGNRTTISYCSDTMIGMSAAEDLALDAANNRAFLITSQGLVAKVDLSDGTCSIISSGTVGSGPGLSKASAIAYDDVTTPASPRLLIGAPASQDILELDPATGQRNYFSHTGIQSATSMRVDASNHSLLVLDAEQRSLVAFDLQTGTPTVLAGAAVGSGADMVPSRGLAVRNSTGMAFTGQRAGEILSIDTTSLARQTLIHSAIGSGPRMSANADMLIEQHSGTPRSLLVSDVTNLLRIDLKTGNRTVVSSASVGTGVFDGTFTRIALDTRADHPAHAFVVMRGLSHQLVSIDLATGNRELIVDTTIPSSTRTVADLRFDAAQNRLIFSDVKWSGGPDDAIHAVDLATGQQTTISSSTVGGGPSFKWAGNFVLDPLEHPSRAIVSNSNAHNILSVDLASGERTVFAAASSSPWSVPVALALDSTRQRIIGLDTYGYGLFEAAISGGELHFLSGRDAGAAVFNGRGPMLLQGNGVDVDAVSDIAYLTQIGTGAIMAVDLSTGDRVLISR